jgi:hypothetical protein
METVDGCNRREPDSLPGMLSTTAFPAVAFGPPSVFNFEAVPGPSAS